VCVCVYVWYRVKVSSCFTLD